MTLQVLMPQRQSDPLDQIAKGLQIAQAIYGIKTAMEQGKLRKYQEQEAGQAVEAKEMQLDTARKQRRATAAKAILPEQKREMNLLDVPSVENFNKMMGIQREANEDPFDALAREAPSLAANLQTINVYDPEENKVTSDRVIPREEIDKFLDMKNRLSLAQTNYQNAISSRQFIEGLLFEGKTNLNVQEAQIKQDLLKLESQKEIELEEAKQKAKTIFEEGRDKARLEFEKSREESEARLLKQKADYARNLVLEKQKAAEKPASTMLIPTGDKGTEEPVDKERYVPGWGVALTKKDAQDMKSTISKTESIKSYLKEMIALREKYGSEIMNRDAVERGKQLSRQALIEYKNIAGLGVLSAQDVELVESVIPPDPLAVTITELPYIGKYFGKDPVMGRLNYLIEDLNKVPERAAKLKLEKRITQPIDLKNKQLEDKKKRLNQLLQED